VENYRGIKLHWPLGLFGFLNESESLIHQAYTEKTKGKKEATNACP